MKKILCFLFMLTLLIPFQADTKNTKSLKITKNNIVLVNLAKNNKTNRAIKLGKIQIEVLGDKKLQVIYHNDKIYLHISGFNVSEEGIISISFGSKQVDVPYEINYYQNNESIDISRDFLRKNIQQRPLSCEASVAADIIYFLNGNQVDEYETFDKLDKDLYATEAEFVQGKYIWGNPDKGFVGHVEAYGPNNSKYPTQRLLTGYGVYEKPMAKLYNSYGLETEVINSSIHSADFTPVVHLSYLLDEFNSGKMVQLWGDWCTYSENDDGTIARGDMTQTLADSGMSGENRCATLYEDRRLTWFYKQEGELIKHEGWRGEHAFYLLGYTGNSDNPSTIKVWDTDTGFHEYPISEWMRKWSKIDYRSLIIWKK